MPRQLPSGTPVRTERYVFPQGNRRLWLASTAFGVLVMLLLVGTYFAGARRSISPGPVASVHAPFNHDCVQCHTEGQNVADLRCERCHDPGGVDRMTHGAHVFLGSRDARKAEQAQSVACVTCHTDHRGLTSQLRAVEDRECASCHEFSTMRRHPEFGVVRAAITTGLGIKFPHDKHLAEVAQRTSGGCGACHQTTPDQRGFVPISFDTHCATCHLDGGAIDEETDSIPSDLLVLPAQIAESWAKSVKAVISDGGRGTKKISRPAHRDPFVLYNATRLRRGIDPDGVAAERAVLTSQISWLEQQRAVRPLGVLELPELDAGIAAVQLEVDALRARVTRPPAPGDDRRALGEMAAAVQTLARQMVQTDATIASDATTLATDAGEGLNGGSQGGEDSDDPKALFTRRLAELRSLVDAIAARGDESLKSRAQGLQQRIEALTFRPSNEPADLDVLQQRLSDLEDVLQSIAAVPDPSAQLQAAQLDVLRRFARQRVGAGLSSDEFETRRRELLTLLTEVERRGGDGVRLRVANLRQRIASLRPGESGDADLRRTFRQKQKLLDRLRLERELATRGGERQGPLTANYIQDQQTLDSSLATLRQRLADLDRGPRMGAPIGDEDRDVRAQALDALLGPCTACHELSGARLAPVRIAEPVLTRSIFNHKPHITQTSCDNSRCHDSAKTSKLATDVNVPGVANCRSCHNSSQVSADCETCHVYHPPSLSAFARIP